MEDRKNLPPPVFHTLRYGASLALGIAVALQTYRLYEAFAYRADWLYWDPAAHAFYGVRVAEAVRHLHLLGLLRALNEQTLWPPLHSLLQLPFQLLLGPGFYAAALCSFVCLALLFPALTFLYHQIDDSWFGWAALLAFAATSPMYAGYGSMPMLEIFGALFTVLSATLYLKNSRWFPLSLTFLFFLKYNYCLYILMPVVAVEIFRWYTKGAFKTRACKLGAFEWFLIATAALMILILVTGGFKIGGLSVRGIGNPLYALYLIVLIREFVTGQYREHWRRIRGTGWEWFVVPVLIWMVIPVPNRVKTLVSFAINAPLGGQEPGELSYYTFYLDALSRYFPHPWLTAICGAAASAVTLVFRKRREVLFLALLFALPFLLMTVNQNKQDRFLFTFVFALWVLCATGIARIRLAPVRAAAAVAVIAGCLYFYNMSSLQELVAWPFVPVAVEAQARSIARQAAMAKEVRILGTTNEMSPALLSHQIMRLTGFEHMPHLDWEVEKNPPPDVLILKIHSN